MRTLVLGGDGLVGRHVVQVMRGRDLVVTTRSGSATSRALDMGDAAAVRDIIQQVRPKAVVLAAAIANAERCEDDPTGSATVNVEAARIVAAAATDLDAQLIAFSSEYVFPGGKGRYREEDAVGPINEYGRQKVALERAVAAVPRHLVLRTSGVFGWEPACKNFVCRVVSTLRRGQTVVVPDDQAITPTYAHDLAWALVELMDRGVTGLVHAAGPRTMARLELSRTVAAIFGLDDTRVEGRPSSSLGYHARRPLDCGLDDTRLRELLGRSLRSPEDALTDMRASEPLRPP